MGFVMGSFAVRREETTRGRWANPVARGPGSEFRTSGRGRNPYPLGVRQVGREPDFHSPRPNWAAMHCVRGMRCQMGFSFELLPEVCNAPQTERLVRVVASLRGALFQQPSRV